MRTPEQHRDEVAAKLNQRSTARFSLADAVGLTLAETISAQHDSPRFDNSQMDGYALGEAHVNNPGIFETGATLAAGTDPADYYPNGIKSTIVPIMTGARIPDGTAAIVPVEACDPHEFVAAGDAVSIPPVNAGQFIRRAGSDITAGAELLKEGTVLTPAAIATLASQSIDEVTCVKPSRIVICTGGKEISGPDSTGPGDDAATIPDSNGPMLRAQAARYGIEVAASIRTDDDPEALRADFQRAIDEHQPDAIITSGGISHGKFEVIRQVLETAGWFGHVDQQPGGPQGISSFSGVPVICLPGNPVSTLVSFRLFVAPLLGTAPAGFPLTGADALTTPIKATVDRVFTGLPGRDQFLRGTYALADGHVTATPLGGAGSHLISQAADATALIRIPADKPINVGESVDVYPL